MLTKDYGNSPSLNIASVRKRAAVRPLFLYYSNVLFLLFHQFAHTTLQALLLKIKQVDESPEDSPSGPHQ
ncbi:hypothetical protein BH11PAT2_BH11PAT2_08810 [soil metagenome]